MTQSMSVTIKLQPALDTKIEAAFSLLVDTEEEAEQAGVIACALFGAFVRGYGAEEEEADGG